MRRTRGTTMAGCVAVVAVAVYAVMWVGYRQNWGWLHSVDWSMLHAAHSIGIKHPMWVWFWDVVSFVLGPTPLRLLGIVGAVVSMVKRNVRAALLLLTCLPLSGLVTVAAKSLVNRPRPVTALVTAPSTSFPSGHSLEVMAGALALVTVLVPVLSRSAGRIAVVAALAVLMVGIARVALNVHYPSDVMAGWALGYLYFLLCLWIIRPTAALSRGGDETGAEPLLDPAV